VTKKTVTAIAVFLNAIGIERALAADIPLPECQETKLAEQVIKQQPIFPINVDFAEFSRELQILRARPQPSPIYMGVSQPIARGKISIRTVEASSRRPRKVKNGLVLRCKDSVLFATSAGLPAFTGSYSLKLVAKAPNDATINLIDSSMKARSVRFVPYSGTPGEVVAITSPFKGPKAALVIRVPLKLRTYEVSLTQIIPRDWPVDPQALIPGNWSPSSRPGGTAPRGNEPTPELDAVNAVIRPAGINDQTIPADFLDYECMRNHNLFNRFPGDLRSHVNAIGLLEMNANDPTGRTVQGYCTATLVRFDRDPANRTFVLTANHCIVGDANRDAQQNDIVSATVFWDYRNAQCTRGPPDRWSDDDIHNLASSNANILVAATATTDAALLDLNPVPTDRDPLRAGGTPDYTADNVFRMRFHHADIRPLMGSEPYWDWKTELGLGYSAPCAHGAATRARDFFYSMWIVHEQSSASAKGASGSAVIDQRGHLVGQLWGWCHGRMSEPGYFYNYDADGKIERTLNIFGFP
jgi:hypothetical protein